MSTFYSFSIVFSNATFNALNERVDLVTGMSAVCVPALFATDKARADYATAYTYLNYGARLSTLYKARDKDGARVCVVETLKDIIKVYEDERARLAPAIDEPTRALCDALTLSSGDVYNNMKKLYATARAKRLSELTDADVKAFASGCDTAINDSVKPLLKTIEGAKNVTFKMSIDKAREIIALCHGVNIGDKSNIQRVTRASLPVFIGMLRGEYFDKWLIPIEDVKSAKAQKDGYKNIPVETSAGAVLKNMCAIKPHAYKKTIDKK